MSTQDVTVQAKASSLEELRKFAEGGSLYAILDACDAPGVPPKARELGEERAVSLFRGTAQEDYWAVAPYLVRVDSAVLDWIVATLWKEPWGIFAVADTDLETLRKHFRKFLIVELPDGKQVYFRYYDPRILNVYVRNSLLEELQKFFGPVRIFGLAYAGSGDLLLVPAPTGAIASERQQAEATPTPLWRIRREQYEAFERIALKNFEDRMAQHVKEFFPQVCEALGDEGTRDAIRYGIQRAANYQISIERDVCKYIDLVFTFGRDFDRDPGCAWASAILHDTELEDPGDRVAQLYDFAMEKAEERAMRDLAEE